MHVIKKAAIAMCLLGGSLAVQPAEAAWGIGPLGGANFSDADIGGGDTRSVTGWAFGARLEMGTMPFLSVMLDPMLVQSGAEFDASATEVSGKGEFVFLEIPLLLTARLNLAQIGFYGFLGPNLVLTTDAGGSFTEPDDLDRDDVSTLGLAGQIGGGLTLGVAPTIEISADARYSHGFTDMLDEARDDIRNWRSREVRLTLGVLLHTPRLGPF